MFVSGGLSSSASISSSPSDGGSASTPASCHVDPPSSCPNFWGQNSIVKLSNCQGLFVADFCGQKPIVKLSNCQGLFGADFWGQKPIVKLSNCQVCPFPFVFGQNRPKQALTKSKTHFVKDFWGPPKAKTKGTGTLDNLTI